MSPCLNTFSVSFCEQIQEEEIQYNDEKRNITNSNIGLLKNVY